MTDHENDEREDAPSVSFGTRKVQKLGFDYLVGLRTMIEDMNQRRKFDVSHYEFHEPAPDVLVEMMESGLGHAIPEAVLSFYQRVSDGFDLTWSYEDKAGEQHPGGAINVHNFGKVFSNWLDELWGVVPEDSTASAEDFSWEIRGLETVELDSGPFVTVLHVPEVHPEYSLFFYSTRGDVHRLDVTFTEYFECLLQTRGFKGWQFLVSDVDFSKNPEALELATRFHRVMPGLFPDEDFSDFRNPENES